MEDLEAHAKKNANGTLTMEPLRLSLPFVMIRDGVQWTIKPLFKEVDMPDAAQNMAPETPAAFTKGGVDLDPTNMDLKIDRQGTILIHADPLDIEQARSAAGYAPVIINMFPLDGSLPFLRD